MIVFAHAKMPQAIISAACRYYASTPSPPHYSRALDDFIAVAWLAILSADITADIRHADAMTRVISSCDGIWHAPFIGGLIFARFPDYFRISPGAAPIFLGHHAKIVQPARLFAPAAYIIAMGLRHAIIV